MTTTTHYTALLADDRQARFLAEATASRLAMTARSDRRWNRRPRRPALVLTPANTLQTRPAC